MLSASIPVSSRLNHQRTVITVNAGATEERAEKARGRIKETRERVAVAAGAKSCSLSQPHPQLSHIHTHTTLQHTLEPTHIHTCLSAATYCCSNHFAELNDNIQICIQNYSHFWFVPPPISSWFPCANPSQFSCLFSHHPSIPSSFLTPNFKHCPYQRLLVLSP